VVSGVILGFDTDTAETPAHIREFIRGSNIPMLTINFLQALPRTPHCERLAAEIRIVASRESNVVFRQPSPRMAGAQRRHLAPG
jgi:hypothetical protein